MIYKRSLEWITLQVQTQNFQNSVLYLHSIKKISPEVLTHDVVAV